MAREINILLVDDHPIVRQGLIAVIHHARDFHVCGEAETASQALDLLDSLRPDIVLVDISLPDKNGLELIKDIKARHGSLPCLVLSMHDELLYAERSLRAGAGGYIMKLEPPETLIAAIRQVVAGEIHVSKRIASRLLSRFHAGSASVGKAPMDRLSDREFEVFQLIGRGQGTREIATKLHLSIKTIETYREHIKNKLDLKNADELRYYAVQWMQSNTV